jgi:signal transduction histidine kinase
VVEQGVDAYVTLPTSPSVCAPTSSGCSTGGRSERGLRTALEQSRRFEQAYKESERVKDDLIHMLVHDLKSPISSVMGLLDHSLEMLKSAAARTRGSTSCCRWPAASRSTCSTWPPTSSTCAA